MCFLKEIKESLMVINAIFLNGMDTFRTDSVKNWSFVYELMTVYGLPVNICSFVNDCPYAIDILLKGHRSLKCLEFVTWEGENYNFFSLPQKTNIFLDST